MKPDSSSHTNFAKISLVIMTLTLIALATGESNTPTREQRELKMADDSIMASLAVSASPKGRYICAENRVACLGGDKAELGLALIGARSTPFSLAALADVVRYRTDAGLSEDYECYVLQKGKPMETYLLEAQAVVLAARCNAELQKMVAVDKQWFEGLKTDSVCADEQSIKMKILSLRATIRAGRKCSAGDF
jgi:hypothetical protein